MKLQIMEQLDALILEDEYQKTILDGICAGVNFKIVSTSTEFQMYLRNNGRAKLYFLDNYVPRREGEEIRAELEFNYKALKRFVPDAKVFYIGSDPEERIINFCSNNNIQIISKYEVGKQIKN